jgi:DNA-directed RNA polymerase subunit RPC12/RpoP
MSDILQSLKCTQCGGGPLTDNANGTISCPYCGSTFVHPERVCPHCETVNEPDARQCVACGEKLKEPCARCGTLNWAMASYCQRCGAALDVLEHIALRRSQTDADRLRSIQAEAPRIKEETERFLQAQKEQMWAQERKRLETLAKNKAEQQRQERLIWAIATAAIVIMVVVVVALTVMAQLRPH